MFVQLGKIIIMIKLACTDLFLHTRTYEYMHINDLFDFFLFACCLLLWSMLFILNFDFNCRLLRFLFDRFYFALVDERI